MTFNVIQNQASDQAESNELYLKMRTRFDFSGNRTIGEFMMAKAESEGYRPHRAKTRQSRSAWRDLSKRHPVLSTIALLLSCALFLFCTIRFMNEVSDVKKTEVASVSDGSSISISTVTEPSAVRVVFPQQQQIDTTME